MQNQPSVYSEPRGFYNMGQHPTPAQSKYDPYAYSAMNVMNNIHNMQTLPRNRPSCDGPSGARNLAPPHHAPRACSQPEIWLQLGQHSQQVPPPRLPADRRRQQNRHTERTWLWETTPQKPQHHRPSPRPSARGPAPRPAPQPARYHPVRPQSLDVPRPSQRAVSAQQPSQASLSNQFPPPSGPLPQPPRARANHRSLPPLITGATPNPIRRPMDKPLVSSTIPAYLDQVPSPPPSPKQTPATAYISTIPTPLRINRHSDPTPFPARSLSPQGIKRSAPNRERRRPAGYHVRQYQPAPRPASLPASTPAADTTHQLLDAALHEMQADASPRSPPTETPSTTTRLIDETLRAVDDLTLSRTSTHTSPPSTHPSSPSTHTSPPSTHTTPPSPLATPPALRRAPTTASLLPTTLHDLNASIAALTRHPSTASTAPSLHRRLSASSLYSSAPSSPATPGSPVPILLVRRGSRRLNGQPSVRSLKGSVLRRVGTHTAPPVPGMVLRRTSMGLMHTVRGAVAMDPGEEEELWEEWGAREEEYTDEWEEVVAVLEGAEGVRLRECVEMLGGVGGAGGVGEKGEKGEVKVEGSEEEGVYADGYCELGGMFLGPGYS